MRGGTLVLRRWELLGLAGVLLLAAILRLEMLSVRSLWHDEAFSLEMASHPVGVLWVSLPRVDPHPPGYYVMLHLWTHVFGSSLEVARTLSFLWGMSAVLCTWGLGRRVGGPAVGLLSASLVAFNPFQIYNSNEVRMYAPLTAMSVMSAWALVRAEERDRATDWILYGTTVAGMLYLSYYAGPLVLTHGAWALVRRRWRGVVLSAATAFLLYLPWLPALGQSLFANPIPYRAPMRPTYVLELLSVHAFGGHLPGTPGYLRWPDLGEEYVLLLVYPFVVLAAVGFGELWRKDRRGCGLVGASWAGPVAVFVTASLLLRREAAYFYHLSHLQPFVAIAVGAGIAGLHDAVRRSSPLAVLGATVIGVLLYIWPAIDNLQGNPLYQGYRYDLAASYLRKHHRSGDVVVYYMGGAQRAIHHYFRPPGPEVAIGPDRRNWSRKSVHSTFRQVVGLLRPDHRRVWLVLVPPTPEGSVEDLVRLLEAKGYRRGPIRDFNGIQVGLLVRR